jgi:hypothetical protein
MPFLLGAAREPQYCGAERTCMWELIPLASSVHPSVAAFARTLLAGAPIVYDGDPLRDLSLTSFLDKFVARKPKVGKPSGRGKKGGREYTRITRAPTHIHTQSEEGREIEREKK